MVSHHTVQQLMLNWFSHREPLLYTVGVLPFVINQENQLLAK